MQCDEFAQRLNSLLDQRLSVENDRLLGIHAAECGECHQLLTGQARLLELVRFEIIPLRDEFSEQTIRLQVRPPARSSKARIIAAMVATAATLMIVAWPIAWRFSNRNPAPNRTKLLANSNPTRQSPPKTIAALQPGVSQPAQTTAPTRTTSAESEELRRMIRDLWRNLPAVPEEQLEPIDRLAGGFKPLASTLGAALDAIRRSLPVGRDPEPAEPQANYPNWDPSIRIG